MRPGSYLIDHTTSSPFLAKKIFEECKKRKIAFLVKIIISNIYIFFNILYKLYFFKDAPVSGGDIGAKEARLAIMTGGEKNDFDNIFPIF